MSTGDDVLVQLCRDLRLLQAQAGGPSVRDLAATVGLGKSQVSAILSGRIRRPPDWRVEGGLVGALSPDARGRDQGHPLSRPSGPEEVLWARDAGVDRAAHRGPADGPAGGGPPA